MSAASSSLISIATSSNSPCNSKSLNVISVSKINFKTPKLSFNFKTHYLNFHPLLRSSLPSPNSSPPYESIQVDENPESEPSAIGEELEKYDDDDEQEEDDDDDDDEENEPESPEAGRLYVGNLPYAITSSELSQVFGEAGSVVSVEIVYDRVTDRSRGFAFITMASVQEAKEAIRMFSGSVNLYH